MKLLVLSLIVVIVAGSSEKQAPTPPTLPLQNYSAVDVEHKFGGDCQGNKTYGYFADCGERCHKYPIFCQKAKVLRCGCLTGYVQLDSTYLSPCVLPTDCPPKAATYH
ncbi:uncharacterized protein LOC129969242 [Argiope bruennichi]|uniref:uncharacterized protein LOC129969242 n=1 Tax=Argiope bruennichi TaxID=94029 RepID=UPI002494EB0B|nr:uncharacterized protein LOC129969242 [Argiope bruennichi]